MNLMLLFKKQHQSFLSSLNLGEVNYEQKTYQTKPIRDKRKNES